ncbi:MAG: substrate-binding domain-containing protein [Sneathiella sp.]
MKLGIYASAFLIVFLNSFSSFADEMKLAVTTSFHNSGLSDVLLPEIEKDLGLTVHLLVVGTGQALKLGQAGDVDALLVHSKNAEEAFVNKGFGVHRREIMYNDFVFVGPDKDRANISGSKSAVSAFQAIERTRSPFVSRGDDSGTHRKEISLWQAAGTSPGGSWYRATGAGMGATLNTASAMDAYVFTDRASWLNFGNKGNLKLLFSGDPVLFNQYVYIQVSPLKHKHVKNKQAIQLEAWLSSDTAASLISNYKIKGQRLFVPNATPQN